MSAASAPAAAVAAAFALLTLTTGATAQGFETQARAAYVVDHNTGQVLLEHNADLPLPPASMSKLMTLNMVFEALDDGRLTLSTPLPVSQHCMDYGGSTMFLNTQDRPSVEELVRGVVVLSGNDASCVLAEALSPDGTETGAARMMTDRARQLGMMNSTFVNSNGWPAPGHVMSVRDLGILAERFVTEFPEYYHYFAETEFAWDGRAPDNRFNRNPLLSMNIGADGLKTGHTEEAGYGLVGSAMQGDRRVTFVISGLASVADRATEAERIANWGFRQFAERQVVTAGTIVAEAEVFLGERPSVGLAPAEDVTMLLPALQSGDIEAEAIYTGPLEAPVTEGQQVGELIIRLDGFEDRSVPLVVAESVARGGFMVRIRAAFGIVLGEVLGRAAGAETG
ncbi:D-alanyl-D-alanine carboxypeptidase [Rhodobacterales bacterium HKCCE2091]|nr:D-alanyl-D-alanine carboxypeptidase [Rhodobacterales bacterium HKCCE2091]